MADINIQRKRRSIGPLLIILLLLALVAAGVWWYLQKRGDHAAGTDADTTFVDSTAYAPTGPAAAPPAAPAPAPMPQSMDTSQTLPPTTTRQ